MFCTFPDITDFYIEELKRTLPNSTSLHKSNQTALFATFSKAPATNRARMINRLHTRFTATQIGLLHLLPDLLLEAMDAALAMVACEYAVTNFYAPKTIATKTYACSPFVIQDHSKLPFTQIVLKGIKAIRTVEKPVGVVMGKDVLMIFNSTLQPERFYHDLLLVTFDLICTTTVCRTGELAPVLSAPGAASNIITLDKLQIGKL